MIPNININKLHEWADNQFELGIKSEHKRVIDWINKNRSYTETEAGVGVYTDNFTMEDLVRFVESGV